MFTIKFVYEDHDRVLPAAEYSQYGRRMFLKAPKTEAAYVLGGHVEHEIALDDPKLVNVFVINGIGKTVDKLSAFPPEPKPPA